MVHALKVESCQSFLIILWRVSLQMLDKVVVVILNFLLLFKSRSATGKSFPQCASPEELQMFCKCSFYSLAFHQQDQESQIVQTFKNLKHDISSSNQQTFSALFLLCKDFSQCVRFPKCLVCIRYAKGINVWIYTFSLVFKAFHNWRITSN